MFNSVICASYSTNSVILFLGLSYPCLTTQLFWYAASASPPPRRLLQIQDRGEATSTYKTSGNPDPQVKFVCVCFGGAIEISKFSPNPMTIRKKLSKMISWLGGCLSCSNCATHVSCFSSTNHDNNPVVTINYYANTPREGESSGHGTQLEGGSQGRGSKQDALPDLISM